MRKTLILALIALPALSSCGGGSSNIGPTPPQPPPQTIATPGPPNVEPIVLDAGPAQAFNTAFVTINVCLPGTSTCQQIDHIEVDTGSTGLRLLHEALTIAPPHAFLQPGGLEIADCLQFADGSSFGPVGVVDIQFPVSGETATNVAVQIIGDPAYTVPSGANGCPGIPENTVAQFGANGVLGVGPFAQDCGAACADALNFPAGWYYTCPTPATCAAASVPLAQQIQNPVTLFGTDNNGVIVEIPSPPANGTSSLTGGALVFGIGTQGNNGLGSATVLDTNQYGFFAATFLGTAGLNAALDSGSNANFFSDSNLTRCMVAVGFYCPTTTVDLSATLTAASGAASVTADFAVIDLETVFNSNPSAAALPNVGGPLDVQNPTPNSIQFDLGMPYFFGRNVFTAIENMQTPAGVGPYTAF